MTTEELWAVAVQKITCLVAPSKRFMSFIKIPKNQLYIVTLFQ